MSKHATFGTIAATLPETCPGCGSPHRSGVEWHKKPVFVPYQEGGMLCYGGPALVDEEHLEWSCRTCGFVFRTPSAQEFYKIEEDAPEPDGRSGRGRRR